MIAFVVGLVVFAKNALLFLVVGGIPLAALFYFSAPLLYKLMLFKPSKSLAEARAEMDPLDWLMGSMLSFVLLAIVFGFGSLIHDLGVKEIAKQAAALK